MFRHGPVIGSLFHLEVTPLAAQAWAKEYANELEAKGNTALELMEEFAPNPHFLPIPRSGAKCASGREVSLLARRLKT